MAESITIKALQDASLDAKSLEEVVNGDDAKQVTTRLGETYPSVKKAIKTMFENGGFPATPFDTKDKMLTEGASLADDDYAWVTDDTDANNGLYIKKSGVWVFSEFNVLKRVQDYVKRLDAKVMLDDASYLDVAEDKNGDAYRYTDENGELHVTGLNKTGSVQSNINTLHQQSENIPKLNPDNALHAFTDKNDNVIGFFDAQSNLHTAGKIYAEGKELGAKATASNAPIDRVRHQSILTQSLPKVKNLVPIATKAEDGLIKRMPFGITTPTGILCFYHKQVSGYDGDFEGSELWKAVITIDDNLAATVVSRELFLADPVPSGVVKHPMLGRTRDGRILLVFERRTEFGVGKYKQYQCYSSDEGVTFTEPTLMAISGTDPSGGVGGANAALGTTGLIVTAKNNRLVISMYTNGGTPYAIYSDDDGESWTYSLWVVKPLGIGFTEPSICVDFDDNLLMDLRPKTASEFRGRAKSYDNGATWDYLGYNEILSATNQGTIFKDERIGALIQTHNATGTASRTKYSLSLSYDNDESYPYRYQPFADTWYGGYSQILKWREGVYIIMIEYADTYVGTNSKENSGMLILTLSEVLSNVYSN